MKELFNQLTAREKKLLYFLACFLIVVSGWFLLLVPALDRSNALKLEYQDLLTQNSNLQLELVKVESAPETLKVKKENLNQILKDYQTILKDEDVDHIITTMLIDLGIVPKDLEIGVMSDATLTVVDDKGAETTLTTPLVQQIQASFDVEMDLYDTKEVIDALNDMNSIEIVNVSYDDESEKELPRCSIDCIIYMRK